MSIPNEPVFQQAAQLEEHLILTAISICMKAAARSKLRDTESAFMVL